MTFRVGQKVVCVDATCSPSWTTWGNGAEIFEGAVYTVRELGIAASGRPGIRIDERICSGWSQRLKAEFFDAFYLASRFRPAVSRKTDISVFTKMLTPQGVVA